MARPVHRAHARSVIVGFVSLVVIGIVIYFGAKPLAGGELIGKSYTYVTADFIDAGQLKGMRDVRINSVAAGQVTDVKYREGRARVTLRLDGDVRVYRSATVRIEDESPLSKQFVDLVPGTPESGSLGDAPIPPEQTSSAANLDVVWNVFDPLTRTALQSTLREVGGGLGGRAPDLQDVLFRAPDLIGDLGRVSSSLSSPQADLANLVRRADRLTGRFAGREAQIQRLVTTADETLQAVNVDRGKPLGTSLAGLPPALRDARRALDALGPPLDDVASATSTLESGARALGAVTPDLRGALREAVAPVGKVPEVADDAVPAVKDLSRTLDDARPLSVQLVETLKQARILLRGLGPYSTDIGAFFAQEDLLSGQLSPEEHYFSAQLVFPSLYTASLPDGLIGHNPYPKPCTATPLSSKPVETNARCPRGGGK